MLVSIEKWFPSEELDLQELTKKWVMLLALGPGYKVQSLSLMKIYCISILRDSVAIRIKDLIKTPRPVSFQPLLHLPFFKGKPSLCVGVSQLISLCLYVTQNKEHASCQIKLEVYLVKKQRAVTQVATEKEVTHGSH